MEKKIKTAKTAYLFTCKIPGKKNSKRILKGLHRDSGDYYPKLGQTKKLVKVEMASDKILTSELAKLGLRLDKKSTIDIRLVAKKFYEELIEIEDGQIAWDDFGKELYKIIK